MTYQSGSCKQSKIIYFALLLSFMKSILSDVDGHGCIVFPSQRGALSARAPYVINPIPEAYSAEVDLQMHFPAGDKSAVPGAGKRSQEIAAGARGWTPYNPFDRNFRWRASPCGDTINNRDHMKGGKYYNNGLISATFNQGDIIDVQLGMIAHHNGFMEFRVCDVSKCPGGDISAKCFQDGHCIQLNRAGGDDCESRTNRFCSPVDPKHPGRWYLPCESAGKSTSSNGRKWLLYGPGTIRYQLPSHFYCEHCVLQWYWVSANNCNPPGVVEYFTSNRSPKWGRCPGQGNAIGGWTARQKKCGGRDQFPEEYYQCLDIKIRKTA